MDEYKPHRYTRDSEFAKCGICGVQRRIENTTQVNCDGVDTMKICKERERCNRWLKQGMAHV